VDIVGDRSSSRVCRYGASSGAPTEVNIYADVDAAWRCMTERYNVTPDRVVLYGQSIGTVPTVDLASRVKVAGVVLHSPLTSGVRVAFPDTKQTWFFDAFPRLTKISHLLFRRACLQCFDAVGWVAGRASGL